MSRLRNLPGGAAWAVLVVGLLLTSVLTAQYATMQHHGEAREFEDAVDRMTLSIQNRLRHYNTVLRAAAGMFEGSKEVTPSEFTTFISRIELETLYAGMHSIGYIRRLGPDELDELVAQMRRFPERGYHDFRLFLAEDQPEHLIITHIEPKEEVNHEAIGYDVAGSELRRETMRLALERATATATPPLSLFPVRDDEESQGIVVYLPVYEHDEVHGFVFASVRTRSLIDVVLAYYPHVEFEVYDGRDVETRQLLFHRPAEIEGPQSLTASRTIAVAGRPWTIVFRGSTQRDLWLPLLPLAGIVLSVLSALFVWRLLTARAALAERAELLRQQREWLAVTLASIGDAVVATDPQRRVTFMNDRAQELTGWRLDQVFNKDAAQVINLVHERTGEPIDDPVSAALQTQTDAPGGAILVCREGERIPVDYTGAPIRSSRERTIGAVVTFRDIRERRESEQALHESRARLQFALEAAHVGEWDLDLEAGTARRSLRHDQIFGYDEPVEHWNREVFYEHVHPEDRQRVAEVFEKAITEGREMEFQCRIIRPDGTVRWIESHGSVYQRRNGRPTRLLGLVEDITERKRIEEELRRSEERFRNLVTATSSIIWTADGTGTIVNEVESWQLFTGQTPEQYLGQGWLDAVHPDDRPDVRAAWEECNRSASPIHIRYRLWHRSGEYRRVEGRGVPILEADGSLREWVGSITDIEEQERVAEALLVAEQQYRWIVESAVDFAIFTFDLDGKITSWNSGAQRVLGYSEEEIIGKDVEVLFTAEDQAGGQPGIEREEALRHVSGLDERWHIRADGEIFFAAGRVTTLKDDEGNVHGFVKILHDRTSEKRALEALERRTHELQESEARFRTMADSAPVYIWMADTTKAWTWFNEPWLEFTGRKMQDEVGRGWASGIHPDDRERCMQIYNESFDARRPFKIKYRLQRRDGQYRWVLDHGIPLNEPDGTFTGYIGSRIDITDLEDARETLERYNVDLERLVNERTEKLRLSNEQLRLSERMASLGTLAAGIGHDLGNLLLPLRIRLDLIEEHLPPSDRDSVQVIRTSAEYLGNLAKGLRYLSTDPERLEGAGGKTELAAWWYEAQPLLKNTLPKNVALEHQLPENLPAVAVTPAALMQAVFNLVQNSGNALRARESGTVRVWADLESSNDGRPRSVRIGVTDDGPGMDPEVKRRCIEPFYSTKTREFSTGLGLSLVQGVVQRAEGRMEIHSEPGQGTTIILILPVAEKKPQARGGDEPVRRALLLISDARMRAFVTSEIKALGLETTADRSLASLWIVDAEALAAELGAETRGNLGKLKKRLQEIVEKDQNRTIVLLRQPQQWTDEFRDINGRLIRTSSAFKPSEIREALRKAARQAIVRAGTSHGDLRH